MTETTRKTCSRCGETKPLEEFHKRGDTKCGRVAHCKPCVKKSGAERYAAQGDKARAAAREQKRQWRAEATPEEIEALRRRNREWMTEWREANADEARERTLRWQSENRERYLETRAARLDRYKAYNAEYHRQYRELNREQIAEYKRRRRALKAGVKVSRVELDALWTGCCALCGDVLVRELRHPDPLSASVDHIVPLTLGGTHEQSNLQWTHLVCNLRKGARLTD